MSPLEYLLGTIFFTLISFIVHALLYTTGFLPMGLVPYVSWLVVTAAAVIIVRRMGILNYLESFLAAGTWLVLPLLIELFLFTQVLNFPIYTRLTWWLGFPIASIAVILFHQKQHVITRRKIKAEKSQK